MHHREPEFIANYMNELIKEIQNNIVHLNTLKHQIHSLYAMN